MTTDLIHSCWTTPEAARYLDKSSGEVHQDIKRNKLLGFKTNPTARWQLPTWQFADGKPLKWAPYLIEAYDQNGLALMKFLLAERDGGPCYAEQLINGLSGRVILAARQANKWQ
jgi:hypothetical protein